MELELHAIPWDGGEAYRVTVGIDKQTTDVGHAWRATGEATKWAFAATDVFDAGHPTASIIEAADIEGVRAELRIRFRVIELPQDRLTNREMHQTVVGMLLVLQHLSKRSDSREGFIAGIAAGMARAIASELKPEGDEIFIASFVAELRENITAARAMTGMAGEFAKALGLMMRLAKDGGDNGTKH